MYWFAIPNIGSVLKGLSQVMLTYITKLDARTVKTTFYLTLCLAPLEGVSLGALVRFFLLQLVDLSSNHGNNLSALGIKVTYIGLRPSSKPVHWVSRLPLCFSTFC